MTFEKILIFTIFCGLLGIILRRNFLNVQVSLLQVVMGINALFIHVEALSTENTMSLYIILFLVFALVIFFHSLAVLLIKKRSTLHINELTELRG